MLLAKNLFGDVRSSERISAIRSNPPLLPSYFERKIVDFLECEDRAKDGS